VSIKKDENKNLNREFSRTLYFKAIVTFFAVLLILVSLIITLIVTFNLLDNSSNGDKYNRLKSQLEGVQSSIQENNYTLEEIVDEVVPEILDGFNLDGYQVFSYKNKIKAEDISIYEDTYTYPLAINNNLVVLKIKVDEKFYYSKLFIIILLVIFVITLMSVLIYQIKRAISYLKEIREGINIIASGSLDYRIREGKDNEFTDLAKSVNKMACDLDRRQKESQQIEKRQRQLITNVSHDLKTPLTSINGYLDIIHHLIEGEVDEEIIQYLTTTQEKAYQLQDLIAKLFDYSKIINSDIDVYLRNIDLLIMLQQYVEMIEDNIIINNKVNSKCLVLIDPDLFTRVLDNLFSNINKYGVEGEDIIIDIYEEEGYYYLSIKNQTIYDLTNKTDLMFLRTYVEESSRTSQSSGIGLSIVKECLDLMKVDIKSEFTKPYLAMIMRFRKVVEE